jgi:hypothetical protein
LFAGCRAASGEHGQGIVGAGRANDSSHDDLVVTVGQAARAVAGLTWALVALWAVSSLWYPFGWDQGIMAWVGSRILDGGMPYRDAFDIKGPLAHYIFALAQWIFGHNLWGIRVLDLAGVAVAAWVVAALTRRFTQSGRAAAWAAALFVLWFASLSFWHTAQPDGFAGMILCAGFFPLLRQTPLLPSLPRCVVAGLAIGLTIAIKPHFAAFMLVPLAAMIGAKQPARHWIAGMAGVIVAALATVGFVIGWFVARGAFDALVEAHLVYNAEAYTSGAALALGRRVRGLVEYVLDGNVFGVLLPAAIVGAIVLARAYRGEMLALVTWAAVAIGGVVLQNKYFDYQWAPMFAPVVVLGVTGLHAVLTRGAERGAATWLALALSVLVFAHAAAQPAWQSAQWLTYVTGLRGRVSYYDTFGVPGWDVRMADYIQSHSAPDDRLVIMGWNIEVLYMTDRPTVSRLAYSLPLWMGEGTDLQNRYRAEFMRDLHRDPPQLIVVAPAAEPLLGRQVSLDEFPEFAAFLSGYEREFEAGPLELYRRR